MFRFALVLVASIMTLLAAYPLVEAANEIASQHVEAIDRAADAY